MATTKKSTKASPANKAPAKKAVRGKAAQPASKTTRTAAAPMKPIKEAFGKSGLVNHSKRSLNHVLVAARAH